MRPIDLFMYVGFGLAVIGLVWRMLQALAHDPVGAVVFGRSDPSIGLPQVVFAIGVVMLGAGVVLG